MDSEDSGGVLNVETALAHVDGDVQLLSELAAMFLQDYAHLIEEMRESIEQGDCARLERTAHTLKGRLAFFGVDRMRAETLALETMGRMCDLVGALEILDSIEAGLGPALPEFQSLILETS